MKLRPWKRKICNELWQVLPVLTGIQLEVFKGYFVNEPSHTIYGRLALRLRRENPTELRMDYLQRFAHEQYPDQPDIAGILIRILGKKYREASDLPLSRHRAVYLAESLADSQMQLAYIACAIRCGCEDVSELGQVLHRGMRLLRHKGIIEGTTYSGFMSMAKEVTGIVAEGKTSMEYHIQLYCSSLFSEVMTITDGFSLQQSRMVR